MEIVRMVLPVVIGGGIGYFTNYIAIKMLFRPRHEMHIGGWKLPFTPGVIPKNQKRIANAVGNAVSNQLITGEDLLEQIKKHGLKEKFTDAIAEKVFHLEIVKEKWEGSLEQITDSMSDDLLDEIMGVDFMPVIRTIGNEAMQDYLRNPMIAMFLNESLLEAVYGKIEESIKNYVNLNGKNMIRGYIGKKTENMEAVSLETIAGKAGITKEMIRGWVGALFDAFITEQGESLIETIDVREIVTEKIEAMKVEELEKLVLYVMERELKAIVNLGAVIGAVIGVLNIFV